LVVKVEVEIKCTLTKLSARVKAIANTGYETEEPEILIPASTARTLGIWPKLPKEANIREYRTAGGITRVVKIPESAEVTVLTEDRSLNSKEVSFVISELESDVLLSDMLLDKLGIELLKPGRGIWRFSDDPAGKTRKTT